MARNRGQLYNLPPTDFPEVTPSPQAVLRGLSEEELPVTAGLGVQGTESAESLGAFSEEGGQLIGGEGLEAEKLDWTPVSDEEAQRRWEETQIDNARREARMLSDDMVNSRRDLVDKLYGGRDPSLENTKPIIDELKKTQWQTLKATLGDPDEMTPEEKLRAATLKINSDRDAALRVEDQKQANVDRLNQAVSQTNEALGAEITSIKDMASQLQEKHALQDKVQAETEALVEAAKAEAGLSTDDILKIGDSIIAKGLGMNVSYMEKYDVDKQRNFFEKRNLFMRLIQMQPQLMNEVGIRKAANFVGLVTKLAKNPTTSEILGWDEKKKEWRTID